MKITFTRSVLVAGEHHEEGSTAEFDDSTVAYLIAAGAGQETPDSAPAEEEIPQGATPKKKGK